MQSPTRYHHFGLEDAVVTHGFKRCLAEAGGDPIEDIRAGWDLHVRYGLENPGLYALIYGRTEPCGVVAEVEAMILRALKPRRAQAGCASRPSARRSRSSPRARASCSR